MYFITAAYINKPKLIIFLNGEYVDLKGKTSKETIPATAKTPAREVNIRAATQEDLKLLYEESETYGNYRQMIGKKIGEEPTVPAEIRKAS